MYPKMFIDYFRDFARTDQVFVAMPFSQSFKNRWEQIFIPAIERSHLRPYRVDCRNISDSILTDILRGISSSRLVLVDISSEKRGGRNGNVMYELGIAHATRMPEEVIVVRSDDERILFDVNQIRVHTFEPKKVKESITTIVHLIGNAIKEIDLTRDSVVEATAKKLDYDCLYVMAIELAKDSFAPSLAQHGAYGHLTWWEERSILRKLQELGIFETFFNSNSSTINYKWTAVGKIMATALKDAIAKISG